MTPNMGEKSNVNYLSFITTRLLTFSSFPQLTS